MWKAQIAEKKYENGVISISVNYTDETNDFVEVLNPTSGGHLQNTIDARLKQLATQDEIYASISKGDFIEEKPVATDTLTPI